MVRRQNLGGPWKMRRVGEENWHEALVPGSVYADLMRDGTLPDPFWRENEAQALALMEHDFEYVREFDLDGALLEQPRALLRCEGLDTLAKVYLNGAEAGSADNMHITWLFDVKALLRPGRNCLRVVFSSPLRHVLGEYEKRPMWGSTDAVPGFGHLRKAHCMFGWDWGPRLPDAGIWRDICLEADEGARLESVLVRQEHRDGRVTLRLRPDIEGDGAGCVLAAELVTPRGERIPFLPDGTLTLDRPQLWWPRGYGAQPLYTVEAALLRGGRELDRWSGRIGLRTLSVCREKDEWGESFCHVVNGVRVFAMGADYIPEDNILSRVTPERTRRLLEDAALANHNCVRVWGGGYYPDDAFYEICDELGLMVWQDLMYACSFYDLTPDFEASIRTETRQNLRRIRCHASLAVLCGNNEMESFMAGANRGLAAGDPKAGGFGPARWSHVGDYTRMFGCILPAIAAEEAPENFWWPSSPSSGGDFDEPNDPNRGDVHYWDVWHGEKPYTAYRQFHFRYASEFGFQSFPCEATVAAFTLPEDRNIFSRVMERHQRNQAANGKILAYISQTFRYPESFADLLLASQYCQAEAIRYGVEHWRRHRGRCMGAIVWQLNDCWPVASWSSIDYYGRWKALHYIEKRCFQPVLLSVEEEGELSQNPKINEWHPEPLRRSARMNVSNETMAEVRGTVRWALRAPDASVIASGEEEVTVPPLSAVWLETLSFPEAGLTDTYFSCELAGEEGVISAADALFCAPKHFAFADPELSCSAEGGEVTVRASAYARMVWLESDDPDLLLSDNAFDMNAGEKRVKVLRGSAQGIRARSVYDLGR